MNKVTLLGFILLLTTSAYAADIFTVKDFRDIHDAYCTDTCPDWDENCKINNATYKTCIEENEECEMYNLYLQEDLDKAEDEDFEKEEFESCRDFCLDLIEDEEKSDYFLQYNIECTNSAADIEVPVYKRNGQPHVQTAQDYTEQTDFCSEEAKKENASKGDRYTNALKSYTTCLRGEDGDEYCSNAFATFGKLEDDDEVNYQFYVCIEKCSPQEIQHNSNSNADIVESGLLMAQLACQFDDEFHYEMSKDTEEEIGDIFTFGMFRDRKEKYCPGGCPAGDKQCIENSNEFLDCIENNESCDTHLQEMKNIDDDKQFDWESFNQCWEACDLGKDETSEFFYTYHYLCEQTIADEKTPVFDSENDDWTVKQFDNNKSSCESQADKFKQGKRYNDKKSTYEECFTEGTEYCFNANKAFDKLAISDEVPFPTMVCQLLCEPDNSEVQSGLFDSEYQCLLDLDQDLEYTPSKDSENEEEDDGEDDQDDDDSDGEGFTFGKFRELKQKYCPAGCPAGDEDCLKNTESLTECIDSNEECETYHKEMTEMDDNKPFDLESFKQCWAACNEAPETSKNADIVVSEFFKEYHYDCVETIANDKIPEFDFQGDAWTTRQYLDQTKTCNDQAKEEKRGERYNEAKKNYDQCQKGQTYCINAGNLVKKLDLDEQGKAEVPYETMVCQVLCKPDEEGEVQSGLFNAQYQCYTELGAELEYTPTQESEDEEVEEVFTFGDFRNNKERFCPVSCPHNDQQCKDDHEKFRTCTKENTLCKVYHEEIQIADNETQFDLQAFEQCWQECELTDDVSDFFKEYHYDCEVKVANQQVPEFNYQGDAWTTQQFLDNQDSCQEQANEFKQGKRYQHKKEQYDECFGGQTYCINAEDETRKLNQDEDGKAEVPYGAMVCQLLCEPDNTEEKSGLFDAQYQCLLDVEQDLEYTPSDESEKEEDGEDIFTYGEFRSNRSQYCPTFCPTNDSQCKSGRAAYLQCLESNTACKVHLEEMQQRKDDEKFDQDSFNDCHKACEQDVDSEFYQTYSYECENTVAQGKIPQFFKSADDAWTTLQFQENIDECQSAAEEEHRGKRYADDKKAYKVCQLENTEYCIKANKLVESQLIDDEDQDVPYSAMVCQLLCEPQDGEDKSGLFEAQYQCNLDKDTEFEYKATKRSEDEDSYEEDGEDDDVDPSDEKIDIDLGQFYPINFHTDKDVFTLRTVIDTTSETLRSLSVNVEIPSLFSGLDFSFKIGKTSYDKDIQDLDLTSRHSQSLFEKPISYTNIQDFDCEGQETCEGLLTIKINKKHDDISKSNIEAVVQVLQEQTKEKTIHQNGPILLDLSANDSKLQGASQRYEEFEYSKFLYKIHQKTVEGSERFFHISDDLGSGSKFLVLQKIYNEEPVELDDWDSQTVEEIEEKVEDKHYSQQVLDKCENQDGCWYAITIYLKNDSKKQNAFYVGTTVPQAIKNSDKSITVSSNINKNQFMNAFRLSSSHTNGVLTVDISPVSENNADILSEYQVDQWFSNKPLTNENISLVGTFKANDSSDLQFATVSPIDGDYFIFYYYGHISDDESIKLSINQKEQRFVQLTSSDFITLEISPENVEATLYENVHIANHSNDRDQYKFSMKFAKDSKISSDDVLIQTSVIDYEKGALVPQFDSSKSKPWSSMNVDDKGVISYEVNLKDNEKCAAGDGCQLFINFSFKSGKTVPKFHIDVKRDVAEEDKIPLSDGQFREIQLTNDFPSEYMLLHLKLEDETFDEYHIVGKNFESEDLEYYVSVNGKKTDEKAKLLKSLESIAAQTMESFTMQELTELCTKKSLRVLADIDGEDGEDDVKPDDDDDDDDKPDDDDDDEGDDDDEKDLGCEIRVDIQKAKGSTTEFAKGSTTATVQYLKENADKDGNRIYGPVFLPPYNNDKTHMQTITETYTTQAAKNADIPNYIKYHFKIVAIRGQRKIVNLMQTTRDGSQFYLQGANGTKYPDEKEENLQKYFELEDDMSTARYAFKECDEDFCEYAVTLYIKLGDKSLDTNSFYIEAQDYKVYFQTLGQQKSWQTNPRRNSVMQSYKKVNIAEDAQFSINIIEDLSKLEQRRFLKDEPEDDDQDEKITEKEEDDDDDTEEEQGDDDDDDVVNEQQGTYVVCFFDYDTVRDGHNLRVIDTFKTGYPVGIMKPIDTYFVFYYSHSLESVKYDVIYKESGDETPLYTELKENKNTSIEFTKDETTHFLHYQIKHLATSLVTLEMEFEKSDNKKPLDNLHTQVQTYAKTQRNNIFPTTHQDHYGVDDFDGEGVKDKSLQANWKFKNQELGCAEGCNMLFRFNHSGVAHNEPLKFSIKTIETVVEPKPLPGSNLGLILGLTFGGLVIVAVGAFLFIRQQRKKQQSHLDYQDIEYQDKETKVSKFEEEDEDEE